MAGQQFFVHQYDQHRCIGHVWDGLGQTLFKARARFGTTFGAFFRASLPPPPRVWGGRGGAERHILATCFFWQVIDDYRALFREEREGITSGGDGRKQTLTAGVAILVISKVTLLAQLLQM